MTTRERAMRRIRRLRRALVATAARRDALRQEGNRAVGPREFLREVRLHDRLTWAYIDLDRACADDDDLRAELEELSEND